MAIKAGMSLLEMIAQLTRGFVKATGRQPGGLENIKIKQEAIQRFLMHHHKLLCLCLKHLLILV